MTPPNYEDARSWQRQGGHEVRLALLQYSCFPEPYGLSRQPCIRGGHVFLGSVRAASNTSWRGRWSPLPRRLNTSADPMTPKPRTFDGPVKGLRR
jgi:hypothetical protein